MPEAAFSIDTTCRAKIHKTYGIISATGLFHFENFGLGPCTLGYTCSHLEFRPRAFWFSKFSAEVCFLATQPRVDMDMFYDMCVAYMAANIVREYDGMKAGVNERDWRDEGGRKTKEYHGETKNSMESE